MNRPLLYVYRNAKGEVAERRLVEWWDFDLYLYGTCELTGGPKLFRKDRVVSWIEDPWDVISPPPPPLPTKPRAPDVLFTGLSKQERARCEAAATAAGFKVRSTVTKGLAVLVTGPTAGWAKMAAARAAGADLIDVEDLDELLQSGAIA